ncbi:MAG: PAS domain-containing protein [Ferrovibrio sp.]|uniref:PAS domain-containing protein n=1 Tax=Ferrovibrio sp. TaxID=1917215 RepID=UPI00391B4B80
MPNQQGINKMQAKQSDRPKPTGRERVFAESDIIVSKTDIKGRLTYANSIFCKVGLYSELELIGQPHSIVRHPDMPRCIFHFLWERIQSGRELFAIVKNMAKSGDHYWVLAHVTPSFDRNGAIDGYHSNRRLPDRDAISAIEPVYARLLQIENSNPDPRAGLRESNQALRTFLSEKGLEYDEFLFSIVKQ